MEHGDVPAYLPSTRTVEFAGVVDTVTYWPRNRRPGKKNRKNNITTIAMA
jgi:hypothetical protein